MRRASLDLVRVLSPQGMLADVNSTLLSGVLALIDMHHSNTGIPLTEESQQKRYGDNPKFQVKPPKYFR